LSDLLLQLVYRLLYMGNVIRQFSLGSVVSEELDLTEAEFGIQASLR
jgi:hypothetical protein